MGDSESTARDPRPYKDSAITLTLLRAQESFRVHWGLDRFSGDVVARALGISRSRYNTYLTGEHTPNPDFLPRLKAVFGEDTKVVKEISDILTADAPKATPLVVQAAQEGIVALEDWLAQAASVIKTACDEDRTEDASEIARAVWSIAQEHGLHFQEGQNLALVAARALSQDGRHGFALRILERATAYHNGCDPTIVGEQLLSRIAISNRQLGLGAEAAAVQYEEALKFIVFHAGTKNPYENPNWWWLWNNSQRSRLQELTESIHDPPVDYLKKCQAELAASNNFAPTENHERANKLALIRSTSALGESDRALDLLDDLASRKSGPSEQVLFKRCRALALFRLKQYGESLAALDVPEALDSQVSFKYVRVIRLRQEIDAAMRLGR